MSEGPFEDSTKPEEGVAAYYQQMQYRFDRRRRLYIILMTVPAGLAFLLLILVYFRAISVELSSFAVLGFLVSIIATIMRYLQTGFKTTPKPEDDVLRYSAQAEARRASMELGEVRGKIEWLQRELAGIRDERTAAATSFADMTEEQRAVLVDTIKTRLQSEASSQLLSSLEERIKRDSRNDLIHEQFQQTTARLKAELSALTRRGNLNLALGMVTTVAGLVVLTYFVISQGVTLSHLAAEPGNRSANIETASFLAFFVPRLTLVVFIELFAYFFLKLYKTSLSEIKYFQNEITNLDTKHAALSVALSSSDGKLCEDVVNILACTERNYILSKSQTTVDLEKARIDKDIATTLADKLGNAFKALRL